MEQVVTQTQVKHFKKRNRRYKKPSAPLTQAEKDVPRPAKRKPRRRKSRALNDGVILPGGDSFSPVNVKAFTDSIMNTCSGLTPCGEAWLSKFIDPCGQEQVNKDLLRIPDGGIPESAIGQYRYTDTIVPPFADRAQVDLTGRNYSMLVLTPPMLRTMAIVLVNRFSEEFGDVNIRDLISQFNITTFDSSIYPNWVACPLQVDVGGSLVSKQYFTTLSTEALRNLEAPNSTGISKDIGQYRFTTHGTVILHNTPTLFNQATVVCGQFNTNVSSKTIDTIGGDLPIVLTVTRSAQTNFLYSIETTNNNIIVGGVTTDGTTIISGPTPPYTATNRVVQSDGTTILNVGDTYDYNRQVTVLDQLFLRNFTTGQQFVIFPFPGIGTDSHVQSNRWLYIPTGLDAPNLDFISNYNQLQLPPLTQALIAQADPRNEVQLFKEQGGVYLPGLVFQPVFNMQEASAYGPVILNSSTITELGLLLPVSTTPRDSFDRNYSTGVINIQSIPYAASPMFKIFRTIEVVPTENSLFGPFCFETPDKDGKSICVAREIMVRSSHGYPAGFSILGGLFDRIKRILFSLPDHAANPEVLVRIVEQIMEGLSLSNKPKRR